MADQKQRLFWSALLILLGIFFLLDNFRVFGDTGDVIWAGLFGAGGLLGLSYYLKNSRQWWVLFPAFVFLGISGTLIAEAFHFLRYFEGGIFLFALSLAFWVIFVREQKHWWAAIPGGVLTTLAFVTVVESSTYLDVAGSLLFIGLGLTFGILWLICKNNPTAWAKWPAMILLGFGFIIPIAERLDRTWPLIFIIVGGWILWRNLSGNNKAKPVPPISPSTPINATRTQENSE
jgi:hypothetical protein